MAALRRLAHAALAVGLCAALAGCVSSTPGPAPSTRSESAASYNLQLGIAYLQKGNLALAKDKIDRSLKQNPRDANAQSARALLAERLRDEAGADRYYRAALRLAPSNPDISNNYAVFLCRTGRVDEGVQRFTEVGRNPLYGKPEAAFTNAGVCLRGANRLDEAAESFSRALQTRPNHVEAAVQLADLELGRGRAMQSRIVAEQFLGSFRATPDLLLLLVRICRAQGDRVAEDRYARRLRVEFPNSEQLRQLPTSSPRGAGR
jgi:type IV pilus assembly protein PilF